MSFSKRAVHTLEGNETTIGVTDCHAYVDGQIACLSQGTLDDPICFGKSNRHIDRLDGRVQYCALEFCSCCQFFIITRAGGDRCTAEFRLDLCQSGSSASRRCALDACEIRITSPPRGCGFYLMVATLVAVVLYPHMVITVPSGEVGVLWKRFGGGTVLDARKLKNDSLSIRTQRSLTVGRIVVARAQSVMTTMPVGSPSTSTVRSAALSMCTRGSLGGCCSLYVPGP
jgi:hypothetical protein